MNLQKTEPTESPVLPPTRKPLTIRSMLIMTAVLASSAASFGYLWRATNGSGHEIGQFVVMTAMMPLLILVVSYWTLKIARRVDW